jgi:CheY-like chemotaxis protein
MHDNRHLVFLVDDDIKSARLLARMLREDGYEVELAFDGASALSRLTRDPMPALLVVDVRMPHADGVAVARYGLSRDPALPVIFVTSYPELIDVKAFPFGSRLVVHGKPVDYRRLRAQIAEGLCLTTPPPAASLR